MATPVDDAIGLTGNPLIDGLLQGSAWQFGGNPVLTYSLSLNDTPNGGPWTTPLADAVRQALAEWSNVANVTFVETGSGTVFTQSAADIAITLTGDDLQQAFGNVVGIGVFPSPLTGDEIAESAGYTRVTYPHPEGDIFLDNAYSAYSFVAPGGLGFEFILHEIGHALGLKHPFDDGGNGRPTFAQLGMAQSDNAKFTVMSDTNILGSNFGALNPATPMPLDILAIQQIYGANTSFHTGDDVYQLTDPVRTIWDAGGNDTIDVSSNGYGVTIDLRPGGYTFAGGSEQPVAMLGIAYNVTIENAIGNDFNNTIIGNDAGNVINGGGGVDQMQGGKGDDTYVIDLGQDLVVENPGEGIDIVLSPSSYILAPNVESLTLTGSGRVNGTGNELDNIIVGNNAINKLAGGGGNDYLDGRGGVDAMTGGLGNDTYVVADVTPPLPATLISAHGDSGDFITGGQSYLLTPSDGNFSVSASDFDHDGFVDTVIAQFSGTSGEDGIAILDFSTRQIGQNIVAGTTYTDAMRYPFESAGHPGLWFFLDARGSGNVTGSFSVVNAQFDTSGPFPVVLSFSVNFEQHADGSPAAAFGTFNYNFGGGDGGGDPEPVIELPNEGTDTVLSSIAYALPANVENLTLTGVGNITGTGNELNNLIVGNDGANILDGGSGSDTLVGGAGNDTYVVDAVPDVVTEEVGGGTDTVQTGINGYILAANVENLTLTGVGNISGSGNALSNVITGNSGDNVLEGGAEVDTLVGGAGNDTYMVDGSEEVVTEGANAGTDTVLTEISGYTLAANVENLSLMGVGNINGSGNGLDNVLTGNSGNNTLAGSDGADTLVGGAGIDTMFGGLGSDVYVVDHGSDVATENASAGTDTVLASASYTLADNVENLTLTGLANINGTGNALSNLITGNTGDNVLDGGAGIDTMIGGAGHDTLIGSQGIDNLVGGAGDDTEVVSVSATAGPSGIVFVPDVVTENLSDGIDTVFSSASYALPSNVENLVLTGAPFWHAYTGTGNGLNNILTGQGAARHVLDGGAGNDTMIGGTGNDTYVVDASGDVVTEGGSAGTDTVLASVTYALVNNVENLTLTGVGNINGTGNGLDNVLTGNSGNNTLTAGAGNDTIDGGAGNDSMFGNGGNDIYVVDASGDVIGEAASAGTDTVLASATYTLALNIENLTLTGVGNINGTGNGLDNVLTGNSGNNTLNGGVGNDTLIGGTGIDLLTGGTGSDVFLFNSAPSADEILDFASGTDHIDLDKAIYTAFGTPGAVSAQNAQTGLESAITAISGNAGDGQDYLKYASDTGHLYYDADGTGAGGLSLIATLYSGGTTPAALLPTQDILIV